MQQICPRPKQPCDHVRAARMEVPGDDAQGRPDEVVWDDDKSSHHTNNDMSFQESEHGDDDVEHVEVNVYDNDYYTQESDYDMMAPMTDIPAGNDDSNC